MDKFWKFVDSISSEGSELFLEGDISRETWFGDEVTPEAFRGELKKLKGNVTVHLNSGGGDVFAGVSIYNALKDYSKGKVIVKVDGLAASIASVIAMAGDEIIMSPGSMMMVHNPWSMGAGSSEELREVADLLDEIRESIIPIYSERTGLSKDEIIEIMDSETWMSAEKAVEKGFADKVLKKKETKKESKMALSGSFAFNMSANKVAFDDFINKLNSKGDTSMAIKAEEVKDEVLDTEVKDEEVKEVAEEKTEEVEEVKAEETTEVEEKGDEEAEAETEAEEAEEKVEAEEEVEEEAEEAEAKDEIGEAIQALKDENAELKAKLAKLEKAEAKAQAKVNSLENLKAHYANILNMAEEAEGGDVNGKEDDKTVDNTYENALKEAFKG